MPPLETGVDSNTARNGNCNGNGIAGRNEPAAIPSKA